MQKVSLGCIPMLTHELWYIKPESLSIEILGDHEHLLITQILQHAEPIPQLGFQVLNDKVANNLLKFALGLLLLHRGYVELMS